MTLKMFLALLFLLCLGMNAATPIPPEVKKSVVFIYAKPDDKDLLPRGTGFLVGVNIPSNPDVMRFYLVTAKHVLEDSKGASRSKIWIRVNMRTGESNFLELSLTGSNRPYFHPRDKNVDIAVISLPLDPKTVDFLVLPDSLLVAKAELGQPEFREGADIFFTGMFVPYMGYRRNVPIVRFGRLAFVTDELDLYLVEATSFGGNSGAPVFLYLGADRRPGRYYHWPSGDQADRRYEGLLSRARAN